MAITFHSQECTFLPKERRRIAAWIRETCAAEGCRAGDIAYIFCAPEYHLEVNRTYLHHDYHTDVITFDYSEGMPGGIVAGDIFIDPWTVRSNADIVGTEPREELMRVIIHGVLHLCGHGDKTPDEEKAMRALEDRYLELYRAGGQEYPPFALPAR